MASTQHSPTSSYPRAVRLRIARSNRASQARRWRARHPLIVAVATVLTALTLFAPLMADRQLLVQELACATGNST
ncbi:MAG: hypothetical protein VX487_05165 [Actinomycetota bacterium]|nr:hypothetical protein [Actinomycetota bacterium]MEC7666413.1 hypothetical protein [Actinomycetota bacterium]MEC8521210.1 hypothetical protein [Actinomycetota bacterium]